jgi:hypothetical protein
VIAVAEQGGPDRGCRPRLGNSQTDLLLDFRKRDLGGAECEEDFFYGGEFVI